jgi:acetyltransferase EpsM
MLGDAATYHELGSNYRMSDIGASFILSYLQHEMRNIIDHHRNIFSLFLGNTPKGFTMFPNYSDCIPVCSAICLLADYPIDVECLPFLAKKYYKPLRRDGSFPVADDFYARIICIPCNIDIPLDVYTQIIITLNMMVDTNQICRIQSSKINVTLMGAGGHAKVIIDAFMKAGVSIDKIYDDRYPGEPYSFYDKNNVVGTIEDYQNIYMSLMDDKERIGNLFCTVGDNATRKRIVDMFEHKYFVNCVHPMAVISPTAIIGIGNYFGPCSVVSSDVIIGNFNIINDCCFIGHDCVIGNYTHVCPNASLGGRAILGNEILLGTGATVLPDMIVGDGAIIGAGSVVVNNVDMFTTVIGVPAKKK